MRSDKWHPCWRVEGRRPSFISQTQTTLSSLEVGEFNGGCSLWVMVSPVTLLVLTVTPSNSSWGTLPAMDIINLAQNEEDKTRDFNLAFVGMAPVSSMMCSISSQEHGRANSRSDRVGRSPQCRQNDQLLARRLCWDDRHLVERWEQACRLPQPGHAPRSRRSS